MFKDHFSGHAADYSQARPGYPEALFEFICTQVEHRHLAWDCATGNGQAAIQLIHYFDQVVATDASETQIKNAFHRPGIQYRVATAEDSGLDASSVDLITVAQALHWFDHDLFFKECHRVLKPGGVFATWWYRLLKIQEHPTEARDLLRKFYEEITGPYWPHERKLVDDNYQSIAFPFTEIPAPDIKMDLAWTLQDLLNYLNTWSGVKKYEAAQGKNPVFTWFQPRMLDIFGRLDAPCPVTIPLSMKLGKLMGFAAGK